MGYAATFETFANVTNITAGQKLVLAAIATFTNAKDICWPSVATIAKRCCLSARSVQRHLAKLVNLGYLKRIYQSGKSATTILNRELLNAQAKNTVDTSGSPPDPMVAAQVETAAATQTVVAGNCVQTSAMASPKTQQSGLDCLGLGGTRRQEERPAGDGLTHDSLSYLPTTSCHPEPVIGNLSSNTSGTPATAPEPAPQPADIAATPLVCVEIISKTEATPEATAEEPCPLADVSAQLLEDLAEVRKAKKKAPKPTKTEVKHWYQVALDAGWTMPQLITTMVLRGWTRIEPGWIEHVPQASANQAPQVWQQKPYTPPSPEFLAAMREKFKGIKARLAPEKAAAATSPPPLPH